MSDNSLIESWPGSPSAIVFRLDGGLIERVAEIGDLDDVRPWASVSKMAVALAMGVENDWDLHKFTEGVGPRGATIANLLSHSSGLGPEPGDPVVPIATKRVYSNYGYDFVVQAILGTNSPQNWLADRVFSPLGMATTRLEDRPAAGVSGSTNDLLRLGVGWLRPDGIARETRNRMISPYLPDLDGIVPGFGRFTPNPWGIGPEIRGSKRHWMGEWPPESFGHFGQSGALILLNAQEHIGVVATSTVAFGPWAVALWPEWVTKMRSLALSS